MADGFAGDPGHEGSAKPMDHLQGTCAGAHVQAPMTSEAMNNPRSASDAPVAQSWNTTVIEPGHPTTGSNDKNMAH